MKKTLLLCGLGLTVATSMVAGTMAIYTHTDTILNYDQGIEGTAKKFYISSKMTTPVADFKLAPGEFHEWDFEVTNIPSDNPSYISEVTTDLVVTVDPGTVKDWVDLKVYLVNGASEKALENKDGNFVISAENAFPKDFQKTETYTLKFVWDDSTDGTLTDIQDTALVYGLESDKLPSISGITVTVTGNQHVE